MADLLIPLARAMNLEKVLPNTGWEERHSPGNFTYEA
jgi:hypothetical protein